MGNIPVILSMLLMTAYMCGINGIFSDDRWYRIDKWRWSDVFVRLHEDDDYFDQQPKTK